MKKDKDDIIKICDEIERCRKTRNCDSNGIICAKKYVQEYIGRDHNKLLKLKTEILYHKDTENDHEVIFASLISTLALIIAIMSVYNKMLVMSFGAFSIFVIGVINAIMTFNTRHTYAYKRWIRHIEVVLDDIENVDV